MTGITISLEAVSSSSASSHGVGSVGSPAGRSNAPALLPRLLRASVRVPAHDRRRLEHLCRYLLRPPLGQESGCGVCPTGGLRWNSSARGCRSLADRSRRPASEAAPAVLPCVCDLGR